MRANTDYDLVVAGAGFAGLVAAAAAASRGLSVAVMEATERPGARLRTTGILVKEAAEELDFPAHLTRKVRGVRLYAPNLKHVDLFAPGYYFLATDTGALLEWLARRARSAGAHIVTRMPFRDARTRDGAVEIDALGTTRFVLGADGANSQVARCFGLGRNRRFLTGIEGEFPPGNDEASVLHCFLDSRLAPGYLGWVVPGVGLSQIGLAVGHGAKPDLKSFLRKIAPVLPIDPAAMQGRRGGLIPCGGLVRPFASRYALLTGDAAGLVSPLTGGGIHCALRYGRRAALAICDYLLDGGEHPGVAMARHYPRFVLKRMLRWALDANPPAGFYNAGLDNPAFLAFARWIYFRRRGTAPECLPETETGPRPLLL
jgi:digeranylgeranylglycerophospholipid reductase